MADPERLPGPVVVALPAEIDMANAESVGERLRSAFIPGITVVVADMTSTVFCDSYWFQAVTAGNQIAIEDVLASSGNAWNVSDVEPVEEVLHRYRANIEHADGIIASRSLDAAPAWWPDFFG